MFKILIVDDEAAACNMLRILTQKHLGLAAQIFSTTDPVEGLRLLEKECPSLVLLDIEMPGMTGFDFLAQAAAYDFDVIFVTAYDQYAIKAIRFSALDYLMKPVDLAELGNALNRYRIKRASGEKHEGQRQLVNNLFHNIGQADPLHFRLALSTGSGIFLHSPAQIIMLEAQSNYTKFYFANGKSELVCHTLKDYEDLLSEHGFMRVHKSYLVNHEHVVKAGRDGIICMKNGMEVPISRRRKTEVLEWLSKISA